MKDDLRELAEQLQSPDIRRQVLETCDSYERTQATINRILAEMQATDGAHHQVKHPDPLPTRRIALPPPHQPLDTAWIADLLVVSPNQTRKEVSADAHEEEDDPNDRASREEP